MDFCIFVFKFIERYKKINAMTYKIDAILLAKFSICFGTISIRSGLQAQ